MDHERIMYVFLASVPAAAAAILNPSPSLDVPKTVNVGIHIAHILFPSSADMLLPLLYLDFTTAVRTGKNGMGGISLLLIEKDFPGVKTRKMDCSGVWASGTTYVTFE